jgi:hypothetical protein
MIDALPGRAGQTAFVVGSGPSLSSVRAPAGGFVIACNRAIEIVAADFWIWVDRIHYERSKWHDHAKRAVRVGDDEHVKSYPPEVVTYRRTADITSDSAELFLHGGTLTVAAHLAVRLGARRVVFLACDAWQESRDRYHDWDGRAFRAEEKTEHIGHLARTAAGIARLARAHPEIEFRDATKGDRYLDLPFVDVRAGAAAPIPRDESLPVGYGELVAVTPHGEGEVVLWLSAPGTAIRAVRMRVDAANGLGLEMRGQAQIVRS